MSSSLSPSTTSTQLVTLFQPHNLSPIEASPENMQAAASASSSSSSTPAKSHWRCPSGITSGNKNTDTFEVGVETYIEKHTAQIVKENEAFGKKGLNTEKPSDLKKHARQLYCNTRDSQWPFVILGRELKDERELVKTYGYLTGDKTRKKNVATGAVLGINPWNCLMNDIFIYAAIKANKAFRLLVKKGAFEEIGKSYALSRELHLAKLNGYTPFHFSTNADDSTNIWLLPAKQNNRDLTFLAMREAIQALSNDATHTYGSQFTHQIKEEFLNNDSKLHQSTLPFKVNDL